MATIKLTDEAWLKQEADQVEGVLRVALGWSAGKPGLPAADLRAAIEARMMPDVYITADMVLIRDELVRRGVIEIVP